MLPHTFTLDVPQKPQIDHATIALEFNTSLLHPTSEAFPRIMKIFV